MKLTIPASVSASYGWHTGRALEDNAAISLRYPNGAIGIAETSFTTRYAPFTIEAHGTEGSLMYNQSSGNELNEERLNQEAGIAVDPAERAEANSRSELMGKLRSCSKRTSS